MSVYMNDGIHKPNEIKKNPITEDYVVSRQVLGLGINGKVVECTNKSSGLKYALKVGNGLLCKLIDEILLLDEIVVSLMSSHL